MPFQLVQGDDPIKYKNYTDAKIGADWLQTHVYISKYCLQIAKCDNFDCCGPLQTNTQDMLGGQFLPTPISLTKGTSTLCDPKTNYAHRNIDMWIGCHMIFIAPPQ